MYEVEKMTASRENSKVNRVRFICHVIDCLEVFAMLHMAVKKQGGTTMRSKPYGWGVLCSEKSREITHSHGQTKCSNFP